MHVSEDLRGKENDPEVLPEDDLDTEDDGDTMQNTRTASHTKNSAAALRTKQEPVTDVVRKLKITQNVVENILPLPDELLHCRW